MKVKPFKREYPGYESLYDIERDVSEWLSDAETILGEFTGTVKVTITYEEESDDS